MQHIVLLKCVYDKLAIKDIEALHNANNIPVKKTNEPNRRDDLYNQYCLWCGNSSIVETKIYKNSYLDNYFHTNFKQIVYNLKHYKIIIQCALEVSKHMSLHCDENAFQKALESELSKYGNVVRERYIPIFYKSLLVYQARIDIEFCGFIIELKLVDKLIPKNDTQLQMYLDNTSYTKGILINFNLKGIGNRKTIDTRVLINT